MSAPVLAILFDFADEDWPSMDLAATALADALDANGTFRIERVQPRFVRRAMRVSEGRWAFNVDRFANRFVGYPRVARALRADLYHVADHSYAHLVSELPATRTGIFCHDIDAFRSVLEPAVEPRPRWYRAMTRRLLHGLERAALVFHGTQAVRDELVAHSVVDPARLVYAPFGIMPEFAPSSAPREDFILHVGSCIPRKRIDVLLAVVARLDRPLVQVGGEWTPEQQDLLERLGVRATQMRGIPRSELASLYQRAALVLQTSEREGFGFPAAEAMACGTRVLASDIPPVREVGGEAVVYAPVGDIETWVSKARALLADPASGPSKQALLARAGLYSWVEQARIVADAYRKLLP